MRPGPPSPAHSQLTQALVQRGARHPTVREKQQVDASGREVLQALQVLRQVLSHCRLVLQVSVHVHVVSQSQTPREERANRHVRHSRVLDKLWTRFGCRV